MVGNYFFDCEQPKTSRLKHALSRIRPCEKYAAKPHDAPHLHVVADHGTVPNNEADREAAN
eukprot:2539803-Pyramimonas_sp.AAC.1